MRAVEDAFAKGPIMLLLDSGAFKAWKSGQPLELDDYCRFLETLPVPIWRYFTLDVIGDAAATMANYETMRRRGFNPVPIFTRGEDPSVLDDYYRTSDLVGIGGLVGTRNNAGYVKAIMDRIAGRPCHWLGFRRLSFVMHFRPYAFDASTWEQGARWGHAEVYLGQGRMHRYMRGDFVARPSIEMERAMNRLGFSVTAFCRERAWRGGRGAVRRLGAASHAALSRDLERRFGTLYFLALTTSMALEHVSDGFRHVEGVTA